MKRTIGRKGQSIVEITLMTPLILIALYIPFDFGMAIFTGHLTQNAVRDGARIAAHVTPFNTSAANNLATQVYGDLPQLLSSGSAGTKSVTVRYFATGAANCQEFIEVRAQGTYNYFLYRLIALFGFTPPDPVLITRTTRMRYERQQDANGGTGSITTSCNAVTTTGTHS